MNKIREVVKAKHLKIIKVAKAARVSRSHLYDIINGHKNPSMQIAVRIAKATGSTLDELFPMDESNCKENEVDENEN